MKRLVSRDTYGLVSDRIKRELSNSLEEDQDKAKKQVALKHFSPGGHYRQNFKKRKPRPKDFISEVAVKVRKAKMLKQPHLKRPSLKDTSTITGKDITDLKTVHTPSDNQISRQSNNGTSLTTKPSLLTRNQHKKQFQSHYAIEVSLHFKRKEELLKGVNDIDLHQAD